jgi:hypothetical protein
VSSVWTMPILCVTTMGRKPICWFFEKPAQLVPLLNKNNCAPASKGIYVFDLVSISTGSNQRNLVCGKSTPG